jgi:hypothetical protein
LPQRIFKQSPGWLSGPHGQAITGSPRVHALAFARDQEYFVVMPSGAIVWVESGHDLDPFFRSDQFANDD